MIHWTEEAEKAFQRYVSLSKRAVESVNADPDEVAEDLRRHIEEELSKGSFTLITEEDVHGVVKRMGVLDAELTLDLLSEDFGERKKPRRRSAWQGISSFLIGILGVALPVFALMVELGEHMCSDFYVNPIPTIWHILLILVVPLANLMVWMMLETPLTGIRLKALGWLNGAAIGIAFFYTLVFIPLVPFGVVFILGMGIGFLPLAPLLSFLVAIWLRFKASSSFLGLVGYRLPGLLAGFLLGILILVGLGLPATITRTGLKMAASQKPETQKKGLALLERFGSEDMMIQSCYQRPISMGMMDPIGALLTSMHPVGSERAREIVFRVTGKPFTAFHRPDLSIRGGEFLREMESDPDQGEFFTGSLAKGISLVSSRMDGSVAPDAALGYLEWTLEFKNEVSWQQEARGQIFLPPGGVVSRLTLWVNGVEREAAFGSRTKTRQAYQQVVQRRRDPVLVTTSGKDRVAFQCFPVPPGGGIMKIRLGITFPLSLSTKDKAFLRLPYFAERNFKIDEILQHSVWVESKQPFENNSRVFLTENPKPDLFALRGNLTNALLDSATGVLCATRNPAMVTTWAPDLIAKDGSLIKQSITSAGVVPPQRVVVVLDGSVSMQARAGSISRVIHEIPDGIEMRLVHAGRDGVEVLEPGAASVGELRTQISEKIASFEYKGGSDNTEALYKAWDLASEKSGSVILWIHGPQPVLLRSVDLLIQRWERRPDGPRLLSLQVAPGPDKVMEKLDGVTQVSSVISEQDCTKDLRRILKQWGGQLETLQIYREKIASGSGEANQPGQEVSMHLVRLWARDQIEALNVTPTPQSTSQEISIASAYKLVTPHMGAVVLENDQQYQVAGLNVPDAQNIPTIPEPQTWMLILVVLSLLAWAVIQQRRSGCLRG